MEQNVLQSSDFVEKIYLAEDGKIVFESNKDEEFQQKHAKEVFLGI